LKQNGSIVFQTNTDSTGHYLFSNLLVGTYSLEANVTKPWGGVNSVDALLILKHFTGLVSLTGMRLEAADIDISGSVNSTDALLAVKRFVGMISTFPAGDWKTETFPVTIPGPGSMVQPITAICYGDVDGSGHPGIQ
jgi:hypothetical protein